MKKELVKEALKRGIKVGSTFKCVRHGIMSDPVNFIDEYNFCYYEANGGELLIAGAFLCVNGKWATINN